MIIGFIFFVAFMVAIICLYTAQKWAYRCFKELSEINRKMKG